MFIKLFTDCTYEMYLNAIAIFNSFRYNLYSEAVTFDTNIIMSITVKQVKEWTEV